MRCAEHHSQHPSHPNAHFTVNRPGFLGEAAIEPIAAHCESCSASCSNTSRTARSRTSGEKRFDVLIDSILLYVPQELC